MILNINTSALVVLTNKLEKLHKSALPSAVRGTLNKAAFNVKQDTMLDESEKAFTNRQPNFFKANSRVEIAKGFNVSQMKSIVGMTSQGLKGGNNFAVKDLEQQEHGGTIKGKSFIPMDSSRVSGTKTKSVRPINRLSGINKMVDASKQKGSKNQRFVKAVLKAGPGGYVLGSENSGEQILWRINSMHSKLKNKSLVIKKIPLYDFRKGRSIKVKSTNFMKKASLSSASKMDEYFIMEATRQIEKFK